MAEESRRPTEQFVVDKAGNVVKPHDKVKSTQTGMVGEIIRISGDDKVYIQGKNKYEWLTMTKEKFKEMFIKIWE